MRRDLVGWPVLGWVTGGVVETWLGRGLQAPPSLTGAALEIGVFMALGWLHAVALRARPGSGLAWPEGPGLAIALAWIAAASLRPDGAAIGGGPLTGGWLPIAGVWGVLAVGFLVMSRIGYRGGRETFVRPRAVVGAAVGAVFGGIACAASDPTFFPSTATFPDVGFAAVLVAGVTTILVAAARWPTVAIGTEIAMGLVGVFPVPAHNAPPPAPLLLLVTVDTLRADTARDLASVRWLSKRGTTFVDSVSASCWTVPSVASWLTGRWPSTHGAGRTQDGWPGLSAPDPALIRVSERLSDAGWRTGAALSNVFLVPALDFNRGFQRFGHSDARPDAPLLVPWLLGRTAALERRVHRNDVASVLHDGAAWLTTEAGPTFLWVHLLDPHLPYHHAVLAPDNPLFVYFGPHPGDAFDATFVRRGNLRDGPTERAAVRALYDAEVARMDLALLAFLEKLEADGLLDGATVLFTADHGEEFWDHGGFEHGHALWPEITEVPMIVVGPGYPAGAVRSDPVAGVDVAATLLAAAGLTADPQADGTAMAGPIDADRLRRIEGTFYFRQQQALLQGPYAWVGAPGATSGLYDRRTDGGWQDDLAATLPEVAAGLAAQAAVLGPGGTPVTVEAEALRALGYVD